MTVALPAVRDRESTLSRLAGERFDLVVVGGGIAGAGTALEAARRGLRVALVEGEDFASGTSGRSSKLIHGGLRYLPMGDLALVRKTAQERKVLHRLAPHLCEPRWMVYPLPTRRALATMRVGVTTYEKLGGVEREDLHQVWGASELADREPAVDRRRFPQAIAFREYVTDDARLVLANLRAAAAHGAVVVNHLAVVALTGTGRVDGVAARCSLTGAEVRIRATGVVNAAGPWVDELRRLEDPAAPVRLHLSKGIHVVLPAERLPVRHLVALSTPDKRSVFALAQGDGVYVGTTDTTAGTGPVTWPGITTEDVGYLLAAVETTFDVPPIGVEDVTAAWAGLRPLIAEPGKAPTEVSRKDEVWLGPRGVVTIAGGKLTGYRPMATAVVDAAVTALDLSARPADAVPVAEPLPGGDFTGELNDLAGALRRRHGLDPATARRLSWLYGSEAEEVIAAGVTPVVPGRPVLASEVARAVDVDGAASLEDVVYRRLRIAWFLDDARSLLGPLADHLGDHLGWDDGRRRAEQAATAARLDDELAFGTAS